ncbi:hypothetical protein CHPG_00001 [Cellulophaga phage phi3:1]|nr:hypothetical protein CHPG_00001 [Cellulophaga phage phi3:1]
MKIKINGEFYKFFNKVTLSYSLDAVASSFSFEGRFDFNNEKHKQIFKPLSYPEVEIYDDSGNKLLTGLIVTTALGSSRTRDLQAVAGYSKCGVLEDCTIPASSYPLEKLSVSLNDVVERVLADFNLSFTVDDSAVNAMQLIYKKTVAEATESVKSFICKLASQRNIVTSHDVDGNLRFFKPSFRGSGVIYLNKENSTSMTLSANGQAMHSHISVIRQPGKDNKALTPLDTIINPLIVRERHIVQTLTSGTETDTLNAANSLLSKQLKNISITVTLNRIENVKCGDIIEVLNEEIFLYKKNQVNCVSYKKHIQPTRLRANGTFASFTRIFHR